MNNQPIHIIILYLLLPLSIISQSNKQQVKYANQLVKEGNHYGASIYYKKALNIDSADIDLIYTYDHRIKNYNNYIDAEI